MLPYRKSKGKARSSSAVAAGRRCRLASSDSPRYTWVPGVQACADSGKQTATSAIVPSARKIREVTVSGSGTGVRYEGSDSA